MVYIEHCPMLGKKGGDCWAESHPASSFGLCAKHWKDVVQDWLSDPPYTVRKCLKCGILNQYDTAEWVSARCGACGATMDAPWLVSDHHTWREQVDAGKDPSRGVVYYVKLGTLVKIGFSASFVERMNAVPHEEILAAELGDYKLESARHKQFGEHLHTGREWFKESAEITQFASRLRAEHGDPHELARKIETENRRLWELRNSGGGDRFQAEFQAMIDEEDAKRVAEVERILAGV